MAYGPSSPIEVKGLNELIHSFAQADKGLGREVRDALKDAGEFVRVDAEHRALNEIRNITPTWARMRLGITGGAVVYIVPKSKRKYAQLRRPKFGQLLLSRAMEPAADENRARVVKELTDAVENLHQNAGLLKTLHNL